MDAQQLLESVKVLEEVKALFATDSNEYLPVIAAVFGAFIGAISTFIPQLILDALKKKREKQNVQIALTSEVKSIMQIIDSRGFVDQIKNIKDSLEKNPQLTYQLQIEIPDHYSRVYQTHINKLGLLNIKEAEKFIKFHQYIDAIVQDIKVGGSFSQYVPGASCYSEILKLYKEAKNIAESLDS